VVIEVKDDKGGGDTWAISLAKVQSNHHHQQTIIHFYRPDALPVAQPTVSKHWREWILCQTGRIKFREPGIPKTSGWLNINIQDYHTPDWYRSKCLFSLERPWKCPCICGNPYKIVVNQCRHNVRKRTF